MKNAVFSMHVSLELFPLFPLTAFDLDVPSCTVANSLWPKNAVQIAKDKPAYLPW